MTNDERFSRFVCVVMMLMSFACAGEKQHKQDTINPLDSVKQTKRLYLSLMPEGFVESSECDSLLFTGLAYASGHWVDLESARGDNGLWYRTPDHKCYDEGRSGSDTSKDQLVGLQWGLYIHNHDDLLRDLYDYGDSKRWVFGRGSLDRTYFLPQFQNTLRALIGKKPIIPEVIIDPLKDHQRHIIALNLILRGEKLGYIRDNALDLIASFRKRDPQNALFQYGYHRFTDGDQSQTISILEGLFPNDRLPNSSDRCVRWLWERSQHSEHWLPCGDGKTHSGGDLTFIVRLLELSAN